MYQFAPNPSGPMHLGGLRTYYTGYKLAKKNGKKMSIRFDDVSLYPEEGYPSIKEHLLVLEQLGLSPDVFYREARSEANFTLQSVDRSKVCIIDAYYMFDDEAGTFRDNIAAGYGTLVTEECKESLHTPKRKVIPAEIAIMKATPYPGINIECGKFDPVEYYPDPYWSEERPNNKACLYTLHNLAYRYDGSKGWHIPHHVWQVMKIAMQGVTYMVRGINAALLHPINEVPTFDYFGMKGYDQVVCGLLEENDVAIRKTKSMPGDKYTVQWAINTYGKDKVIDMLDYSIENDKRAHIPIEEFLSGKIKEPSFGEKVLGKKDRMIFNRLHNIGNKGE